MAGLITGVPLLDSATLAFSLFNTILLLWLGLMVLFNADRQTPRVWLAGGGLLASATFFISHSVLLSHGRTTDEWVLNLWIIVGSVTAIAVPLVWMLMMLWYAGFWVDRPQYLRSQLHLWLLLAIVLIGSIGGMLLLAAPLPSYSQLRQIIQGESLSIDRIPLLLLGYPWYNFLCTSIALYTARRNGPAAQQFSNLMRRRTSPWITGAAGLLWLVAAISVGGLLGFVMVFDTQHSIGVATLIFLFGVFDAILLATLAAAIVLLGQVIVRYQIFTGRILPWKGLLTHWRHVVLMAALISGMLGASVAFDWHARGQILIALLIAVFFALLSRSAHAHLTLAPGTSQSDWYESLMKQPTTELTNVDASARRRLEVLCKYVLQVPAAHLVPLGSLRSLVRLPLTYPQDAIKANFPLDGITDRLQSRATLCAPVTGDHACGLRWAVPIWNEQELAGLLLLDGKQDGHEFTEEEIRLAQLVGARLIDAMVTAEIQRRLNVKAVVRERETNAQDSELKRKLHDVVLRPLNRVLGSLEDNNGQAVAEELREVYGAITSLVHTPDAEWEVSGSSLIENLQAMIAVEFEDFTDVAWIGPTQDTERVLATLPQMTAQVLFDAVSEAIRNSAKHGRGKDGMQPLHLTVKVAHEYGNLEIRVEDDGIGFPPDVPKGGLSNHGLEKHRKKVKAVGGYLKTDTRAGEYTHVVIRLPVDEAALEGIKARERELLLQEELAKESDAKQKAEAARKEGQRLARNLKLSIVVVLLLLIGALVLILFSIQQNSELVRQGRVVQAHSLSNSSLLLADSDWELSLLLAMEAVSVTHRVQDPVVPQAENALRRVLGMERALHGHTAGVTSAVYSPDGRNLLTASSDGTVKIWDSITGRELRTVRGASPLWRAEYSPDGRSIIALSSFTDTAKVWNPANGWELGTLRGHTDGLWSAVFSPDGLLIATASKDNTVKVWDTRTYQPLRTLTGHRGAVFSVAYSPDGRYIVSASEDSTAKVWDVITGEEVRMLQGQGMMTSAAYSPDGRFIVTASADETARVWDAANGKEINVLSGHADEVWSAAYSPDGRYIVTAGKDQTAKIWDAVSGQEHLTWQHSDQVFHATWSPDGRSVVTASEDGSARIWDVHDVQARVTLPSYPSVATSAAYSPDGSLVATTSLSGTIKIWDSSTGQERLTIPGPDWVIRLAYSPNGLFIIAAVGNPLDTNQDGMAKIWNAQTGQEHLTLHHTNGVASAAYSPDGRFIVTASADKTARVWDAANGKEINVLSGHADEVWSAAYSPDGRYIVTAGKDQTAKIWDVATGKNIRTLYSHASYVTSASYSPDGRYIITTSGNPFSSPSDADEDSTAKVWDAASGKERFTLHGHTDGVMSAAWSPDGRFVATASEDGSVKIWDVSTGQERGALTTARGAVYSVMYDPDGRSILTTDGAMLRNNDTTDITDILITDNGAVRQYITDIDELLKRAATRITRSLTYQERNTYLGEPLPTLTPATP